MTSKHANFRFSDEIPPKIALDKRRLRQKRDSVLQDIGDKIGPMEKMGPTGVAQGVLPYTDQAKTVHDFGDGWTVKKLKTYGDFDYEGQMMGHCIGHDAKKPCDSCGFTQDEDQRGQCQDCYSSYEGASTGKHGCEDCGGSDEDNGSGHEECDKCEGNGETECGQCDGAGDDKECEPCSGEGRILDPDSDDEEDEKECDECEGRGTKICDNSSEYHGGTCNYGQIDCHKCDSTGEMQCENCDGEGETNCESCNGTASCGHCDGEGKQTGDYSHYYQNYDEEGLQNAVGPAFSLRDADNTPHVTWCEGGNSSDNMDSIFGKEDKQPVPKHQKKVLQYAKAQQIGDDESRKAYLTWGTGGSAAYSAKDIDDIVSGKKEQEMQNNLQDQIVQTHHSDDGELSHALVDKDMLASVYTTPKVKYRHFPAEDIRKKIEYNPADDKLRIKESAEFTPEELGSATKIPNNILAIPKCDNCDHDISRHKPYRTVEVDPNALDSCKDYVYKDGALTGKCGCARADNTKNTVERQKALNALPASTQKLIGFEPTHESDPLTPIKNYLDEHIPG